MRQKKVIMGIVACVMAASVVSGCEKTPEDVIVTEKKKDNMANYETAEDTETPLQEQLKIPDTYQNKVNSDDGILTIDTDAVVSVPDVRSVDTIKVHAIDLDQEKIDRVTKSLFGDSKIYNWITYGERTKAELQLELDELKRAAAEGNLYPRGFEKDSQGNPYDINEVIKEMEQMLEEAPEEEVKEEVKPQFGLSYTEKGEEGEENQSWTEEDDFTGMVEMGDKIYQYSLNNSREDMISTSVDVERLEKCEPGLHKSKQICEEELVAMEKYQTQLEELAGISYEDAKQEADTIVEKLEQDFGITGMELSDWAYEGYYISDSEEEMGLDALPQQVGYSLHYARVLDDIPITYTDATGGHQEGDIEAESTTESWPYEYCDIIITADGLQQLHFHNPYEIGEVVNENVKLLDFDTIIKNYENMMLISNADISETDERIIYHIDRIKFGYARIYDPKADNQSGVLVPVWDFFGTFEVKMEGQENDATGENFQSFMTINAIDGSIIDRELGY